MQVKRLVENEQKPSYLLLSWYCLDVTAGAESVLSRCAEWTEAPLTLISTGRRPSDTAMKEEEEEEAVTMEFLCSLEN